MRRLALTLAHHPDEAPQSLLGRLASRHGVDTPSFCFHMGLDLVRVANGDGQALDELAQLAGADAAALRRNAFTRVGDHTWTVCGEVVERHMVRRLAARVCPACLAEDAAGWPGPPEQAAYCRTSWLIEQVRTCPKHAVALVDLEPEGAGRARSAIHDFVARLWSSRSGAGISGLPVVRAYVSGLEAYLVGRLAGRRSDDWLDALPFNVVATFTERLGLAALLGPDARFEDLGPDEWKAAGDAGWEVMRHGPRGLAEFASAVGGWARPAAGAEVGFEGSFGKFWPFVLRVSHRPDYHPLCVAFAAHLGELRPALPPRLVPDGEVAGRRGYRLSTASAEHRRSPGTLRRLLSSRGAIGPGQGALAPRRVVLDPGMVEAAVRELGRSMSLVQAGRYLDAPGRQAWLLYSAGFLGEVTTERRRGVNLTVDRAALDTFLRDLAEGAVERDEPLDGEGTLVQAARSARRSLANVTRLVVDRRLDWVGLRSGSHGFSSVLVRLAEVRHLLDGCATPGLTKKEASRILRVSYECVTALLADGHLATTTRSQRRTGATYAVVMPTSLDRFGAEYASISAVAARWGVHPHAARARLAARGVEPALPVEKYGTLIYRWADLPDFCGVGAPIASHGRARRDRDLPVTTSSGVEPERTGRECCPGAASGESR